MSAADPAPSTRRRDSNASSDAARQSASGRWSTSQMESSVTRLLVATKQLLEALTRWSLRNRCTESDISDIYVRLGNDFNSAKLAFQSYGISMDDLASVPADLRACLEECLSEEASPQVLEVHLPRIREIIVRLLQGLRMKQSEYKQALLLQRASSSGSNTNAPAASAAAQSRTLDATQGGPARTASSASNSGGPSAPAHVAGPRPPRHTQQPSDASISLPYANSTQPGAGATLAPASAAQSAKQPSLRALRSRDALERRASKRFSTYTFSKIAGANHQLGHGATSSGLAQLAHLGMGPGVAAGAAAAAAGLHSDGAPSSSASSVNGQSPNLSGTSSSFAPSGAPQPPPVQLRRDSSSQGTPTSTRRNAVLNPSLAHRRNDSAVPSFRAEVGPPPPVVNVAEEEDETVVAPSPMSRGDSAASQASSISNSTRNRENFSTPTRKHTPVTLVDPAEAAAAAPTAASVPITPAKVSPERRPSTEVPPLPRSLPKTTPSQTQNAPAPFTDPSLAPTPRPPLTGELTVFVQQGRQTKRASISLSIPLSIARLRMLFIDKFGYSPGKDDFPLIYVKDPTSGVDYELEESELIQVNTLGVDRAAGAVKDGMVLSLNIEPLDQVKQHLDLTLGNLTREVRELKSAFQEREREARRASRNYGSLLDPNASLAAGDGSFLGAGALPSPRISDSAFAAAGQRMVQMRRANTLATSKSSNGAVGPPSRSDSAGLGSTDAPNGILRAISPQPTGSSISSHAAGQAALELKTQHDEILRLRQEFAVLAQVQNDFQADFKGLLGQLRAKSGRVREIANQDVSMERNFIIAGKAKLDTSSQDVLTLVEDLQDTVDDLKLDVIQRGVKPKPALVKKISQDIERAVNGVDELEKYVHNVKPSWKKTWEVELQNIVDEQEFLNHEEGLLSDLREDCAALQEVFDNIQQVVKLRVASARAGAGGRGYLPPPMEEGHQGLDTVMLEVRSQAVDHDRRLRAVEAAEEKRQRELASSSNDFADELAGFVEGKVLRRTGGHVEAERVRQKRNDATLRAMLTGEGTGGVPSTVQPLSTAASKPKRLVLGKDAAPGPTSPLKTSTSATSVGSFASSSTAAAATAAGPTNGDDGTG